MSKNIVVFSDGTGQDGGIGNNTNVYDLFNMIEARTERQVSFYDPGLGTGWRKVSGAISGFGITRNIRECYQFISDNYKAGDSIFLFGFSRGATTVRTLSAFIDLFGILPHSRPELIKRAYAIYKTNKAEVRRAKADAFLRNNNTMRCRIRFLGVWDTVAALGVPFKFVDRILNWVPVFRHKFHDLDLARRVTYARHAIAIDDKRTTFRPQLWDEQDTDDDATEPGQLSEDDIGDVDFIVEQLRTVENRDPVSEKLMEREPFKSAALIQDFNREPRWLKYPNREKKPVASAKARELEAEEEHSNAEKLRSTFAEGFRTAINDPTIFQDVCKPTSHRFECMRFSDTLRRRIVDLREREQWKQLNRLLLERTYALRPTDYPRIKQVWFSGMHSDVGGGYKECELAHVPLLWMVREATRAGLRIYPDHKVDLRPDALGKMHDSRAELGRLYPASNRTWDANQNQGGLPLVHESVKIRSSLLRRRYEPWILKMNCKFEPWPNSSRSSIQFNDYYIWREAFWGRDNAFLVPWSRVDRLQYKETERELHIHLAADEAENKCKIVVTAAMRNRVAELLDHFDQRIVEIRKEKAEKQTTEHLLSQDVMFKEKDAEHSKGIDDLKTEIAALKMKLDNLEKQEPRARQSKLSPKKPEGDRARS